MDHFTRAVQADRRISTVSTVETMAMREGPLTLTLKEVKARNIKRVTARFTSGQAFQQVLNNTEFVKAASKAGD